MSSQALWREMFDEHIAPLIEKMLREWRPNLSQTTGTLPGYQLPPSGPVDAPGGVGTGYPPADTSVTTDKIVDGSVTPAKLSFDPATQAELNTHTSRTDNPHNVTAAQVGNTTAQWNANQLQGRTVAAIGPENGQVLTWHAGAGTWVPDDVSGGGGGGLTIEEVDGSPIVSATKLRFPSGTLSVSGSEVTYTPAGGGGGGGTMEILSVQADSASSDGGTPVSATQVPGLTITVPASGNARRALVSWAFAYTATHPNHINLFLDGAVVFPKTGIASFPGTTDAADSIYPIGPSDSSPTTYYSTLAEYVVTIPGDSAPHTIAVKYSAAMSTAATTFYARSLVIKLIGDSADVTVG